jgi:four helix bundle protein
LRIEKCSLIIEKRPTMTPQELSDRLWNFAARIGKIVDGLPDTRLGRHVAGQLVRSGTSAPPNYDGARVGESRADFAHKTNVALKEMVETRGWLKFITLAQFIACSAHRGGEGRVRPIVSHSRKICLHSEDQAQSSRARHAFNNQ